MSALTEVAAKLVTLNVGALGSTLYLGALPETPAACSALYEYGGAPSEKGFGTSGVVYESPSLQLVCRGAVDDYATPRALAELAYRGLAAVEAQTLTGGGTSAFYHEITPLQPPFLMRRDESGRVLIACNFGIVKEPSA